MINDRELKFINFLESLKGHSQDSLIESVKKGFKICFENWSVDVEDLEEEEEEELEDMPLETEEESLNKDRRKGYKEDLEYFNKIKPYIISDDVDNFEKIFKFPGYVGMDTHIKIVKNAIAYNAIRIIENLYTNYEDTKMMEYLTPPEFNRITKYIVENYGKESEEFKILSDFKSFILSYRPDERLAKSISQDRHKGAILYKNK